MAAWKWVLGPATGGHESELTAARSRKATWRLTGSHEFGCTIDGRNTQAALIQELRTDLHVLRDGKILGRGRVGPTQDTITATTHSVTVTARDYREVLRRRLLYPAAPLTHGAKDQALIAWDLVNYTQGLPGGNLQISRGLGQTTGRLRDRTYEAGQSVGTLIDQLGAVIDGFDYDIRPLSASALAFDVFYPARGADRGVVLDFGGAVTALTRSVNVSDYANAGRYSGSEGTLAVTREAPGLAGAPEGRWDTQTGDTEIKQQATLEQHADAEIFGSQTVTPSYTFGLKAGWWQGPDHVWLGDTCQVVIMSGRLAVDVALRVFEVEVNVGASGEENVSLTVGAPRPDFARRLHTGQLRLDRLERR